MTFIVSLAHFCEVHGPSMIMCTQVVNDPKDLSAFYSPQLSESQFCESCMFKIPDTDSKLNGNKTPLTKQSTNTSTLSNNSLYSKNKKINDNNINHDADNKTNEYDQNTTENNSSKTTLTLEDQISSLLNSSTNLSNQRKKPMTLKTKSRRNPNMHFISTQFPTSTERYSSLRQTIVRVFTAETNADSSKPIMFGNSKHGYSIALSFSLIDKTARGSERKYSIIVTSNWEADIVNNYTFILTNLNQVVANIILNARLVQKQTNLSTDEMNNNDFYLRRSAGLPKAKSMVEILQDDRFFLKIHTWASFMLDALEDRKQMY